MLHDYYNDLFFFFLEVINNHWSSNASRGIEKLHLTTTTNLLFIFLLLFFKIETCICTSLTWKKKRTKNKKGLKLEIRRIVRPWWTWWIVRGAAGSFSRASWRWWKYRGWTLEWSRGYFCGELPIGGDLDTAAVIIARQGFISFLGSEWERLECWRSWRVGEYGRSCHHTLTLGFKMKEHLVDNAVARTDQRRTTAGMWFHLSIQREHVTNGNNLVEVISVVLVKLRLHIQRETYCRKEFDFETIELFWRHTSNLRNKHVGVEEIVHKLGGDEDRRDE